MSELNEKELAILSAAEEVFLEKGYQMAKTTEIAGKAGVTHAMLHYYYRSKEKIFTRVFEKKIRELATSLEVHLPENVPFQELVRRGVETHFDFIVKNPQLPRFILQELNSNPDRLAAVRKIVAPVVKDLVSKITERMQDAIAHGEIREIEPIHLLYNVASVNVVAFLAIPTLSRVVGATKKEYVDFMKKRKAENVELVLSRLRP